MEPFKYEGKASNDHVTYIHDDLADSLVKTRKTLSLQELRDRMIAKKKKKSVLRKLPSERGSKRNPPTSPTLRRY